MISENEKLKFLTKREPHNWPFKKIKKIELKNSLKPKRKLRLRRPFSLIQLLKGIKRNARSVDYHKSIENMNSEELISDEQIENDTNEWYDDDFDKQPHLFGPSATHHSPVPIEHQHNVNFPFSCPQVLIKCQHDKPIATFVSGRSHTV